MIQKLTMLFCALFLMGCSNDSSDSNTTALTGVLPKKITETIYYSVGSDVSVGNFNYENGVLRSISSGDNRGEYVYQGDKIIKINYYHGIVLSGVNNITYNGNNISEIIQGDNSEKTQFRYETGGLKSKKVFLNDSGVWVARDEAVYSVNGSNITTEA